MSRAKIVLDSQGIGRVLKSGPVANVVDQAAERIAQNARAKASGFGVGVSVNRYTTDRRAASVALVGRNAPGVEAKYSILTSSVPAGADLRRK